MILKDFECHLCGHIFEELAPSDAEMKLHERLGGGWKATECPNCHEFDVRTIFNRSSAAVLDNIVPTYPGCKKKKAGYVHTGHADHDATKIQSGYGGCQGPPIQ
jgi:hypothetical protein